MNELPMPLSDISIAQPSFQYHCGCTRLQLCANGKRTNDSLLQYEERRASLWKSSQNLNLVKLKLHLGHRKKLHHEFLFRASATFEPKCSFQSEDGIGEKESNVSPSFSESVSSTVHVESSGTDSEELDAKEKLRRMKISKAIKGNTPWNKGKKHSPETIQRIRERTKIAMQNPKVRMKLASMGRPQSQETKEKIGFGVRMGWKRRRERLALQETCLFDWQNLIAEAARKGSDNQEELQWDSYEILKKQLQQEWLDSIEFRKTMPKPPRISKRAPKSPEQRRKIAEAIAAKWADPEYRARVCSGLAKYYGTPEGAEGKAKRKPSGEGRSIKPSKKKVSNSETNELKPRSQPPKLKKQYVPKFKDPLANSKLEMLKSIRAQRAASERKKNETVERAKILVAEAEKAAKALEVAAMRSLVAQASLIEARKLIAEATQTIETIEKGQLSYNHESPSRSPPNHVEKNGNALAKELNNEEYRKGVNGMGSLQSSQDQDLDFDLYKLTMLNKMDKNSHLPKELGGCEFGKPENGNRTKAQLVSNQSKVWEDSDVNSLITAASRETISDDPIENSELRLLMDGHHHLHLEPIGVAKLNGSCGAKGTKMQVHGILESRTVTKKWVCGRLLEVVEGE